MINLPGTAPEEKYIMTFYTSVIPYGNTLLIREINEDGSTHSYKTKFKPTLYTPTQNTNPKYHSIHGNPLERKGFESIRDAREFADTYSNVDGFKIYGMDNYSFQFLEQNYKDIKYDTSKIKTAIIDIEVFSPDEFPKPEEAKHPINAITWYDTVSNVYHTYGLDARDVGLWNPENSDESIQHFVREVKYSHFANESELLQAFINDWAEDYPHVVSGWNSEGFDIPYMINRMTALLGEDKVKKLSPWNILKVRQGKDSYGNPREKHNIYGIAQLDYMELFQKHTFENQEFYTLDHISYVILGEKKLDYDAAKGLHGLYKTDYQKFIDYNIKDVELIKRLDEKLNLLGIVFDIAYFSMINYEDTFSPVKTWDSIIYSHLLKTNIIVPFGRSSNKSESFSGAYVKTPKPGLYKWVVSFDLASLYPSIIRQWNIGPDTIMDTNNYGDHVEPLLNETVALDGKTSYAANGVSFSTEKQSFMSELMEEIYNKRKAAKDKMMNAKITLLDVEAELKSRGAL